MESSVGELCLKLFNAQLPLFEAEHWLTGLAAVDALAAGFSVDSALFKEAHPQLFSSVKDANGHLG